MDLIEVLAGLPGAKYVAIGDTGVEIALYPGVPFDTRRIAKIITALTNKKVKLEQVYANKEEVVISYVF